MRGFNIAIILIVTFTNIAFVSEVYAQDHEITITPPAIIGVSWNSKAGTPDNEFNIVYDDFSFYLNLAVPKLEPLGIKFYAVTEQKVFLKFLGMIDKIDLAEENAFVGYVFISSTGDLLKRFHVLTDIEIIELAKKHFKLKGNEQE